MDDVELPTMGPRKVVFEGTAEDCYEFIRANKFNVLLFGMTISDCGTKVLAHRTDENGLTGS